MTRRYVAPIEHLREEQRRARNRAQFYERRDRAGIKQAHNHFRVGERIVIAGDLLAIELATNCHHWSWVPR